MSRVTLDAIPGPDRRGSYGRKHEEYVADFILVTRRHLDEEEYRIFKYHFLLSADWRLCCRKLKMDRGNFFHAVYRIQQRLGRVFRELEPYGLYPINDYFHGEPRTATRVPELIQGVVPIRPPMSLKHMSELVLKVA